MSTTGAILSVLHTLRVPRLAYKRFVLRVREIVDEAYPSYMDAETLRLPFADESGFLGVMAVCRRLVNWEQVGFDPDYIDAETGVPGERAYLTFGDFANELTQAMMTSNLVPYGSEDIYGTIVEFVLHLATVYARVNLTYQAEREMALQLVECLLSRNAAMPQRLVVPVPSIPGPVEQGHSEGVPLRWPVREGRPVAIVEGNPAEAQGYPLGAPIGHMEAEGSGEPQPEEVEEVDGEPAEEEVEEVDGEPAEEEEVEEVDGEPAEEEVEEVDGEPAEEEVEEVDGEPAEEEVEEVDGEPAEEEVEEVDGEPAEEEVEEVDGEPAEEEVEEVDGEPAEEEVEEVDGEPAEEEVEEVDGEPAEEEVEEVDGEPAEEEVEEVDGEPAEEEVEEVDGEPAEEEVEEVDGEPAEEEVEEVDGEPAEEEVEEVDGEPAEEEVEEVDGEPAEEEVEEETVSGEPMDADTIRGLKRNRRDFSYEDEASRAKKASDRYGLRDTPARVERLSRLKEESKSKRKGDNEPGTSATRPRKRFRE